MMQTMKLWRRRTALAALAAAVAVSTILGPPKLAMANEIAAHAPGVSKTLESV